MARRKARLDNAQSSGPLVGLRVLELTNMIAAPMTGVLLADAGAEVVKIEHPVHGDDLRSWPPHKDGHPLWWKVTNRNKRLITLNLSDSRGQELIRRMIPHFDVAIENFRPGTLERWGLSYEALSVLNPKLILLRISGYGQTGPYAGRPGYGTVAEAMSGVPSFTGFPDKPPTLSAFPHVDALAGVFGCAAVLMATYERDIRGSGIGQVIDVSLYESLFRLAETQIIAYDQLGIVKRRNGNRMDEDSPRNAYRTSDDQYIAISAGSQRTFARLATAIGRSDLNDDSRFKTPAKRVENAPVLDELVADWFSRHGLDDAMSILAAGDVVAGPVYDVQRIVEDPHYRARDNIISVADPDLGSVRMHGVTPKFSRTPGCVRHTARDKGHDNEAFYRTFLGLSQDEFEQLQHDGII